MYECAGIRGVEWQRWLNRAVCSFRLRASPLTQHVDQCARLPAEGGAALAGGEGAGHPAEHERGAAIEEGERGSRSLQDARHHSAP